MSEADAIKEIENYLDYEGSVSIQAIATLYSSYQKEKEKNKKLERELAKRKWVKIKDNGEVEPLFYISKDKIREIIKDLDEYDINFYDNIQMLKDVTKNTLQKLLEEE